jgi:hypothetical protein
MIWALETIFVNVLETSFVSTNFNVHVAIKHFQQHGVEGHHPFISDSLAIPRYHVSPSSSILRPTISCYGSGSVQRFRKLSIAGTITTLDSARCVFAIIARIMNHAPANDFMQNGIPFRARNFSPYNFINVPRIEYLCFQNYQNVSMWHAPSLPLNAVHERQHVTKQLLLDHDIQ